MPDHEYILPDLPDLAHLQVHRRNSGQARGQADWAHTYQFGRNEPGDAIDQPGIQEGPGQCWTPFDQDMPDLQGSKLVQYLHQVVRT